MKRILIILLGLISVAYGQTIGWLRYDTVKMAKNGGTTELVLENATKAVTGGVLTNQGNGRTAFVAPAGGIGTASNGLTKVGSDVKLGGTGTENTTIDWGLYKFTQSWTSTEDATQTLLMQQNYTPASFPNSAISDFNITAVQSGPGGGANQLTIGIGGAANRGFILNAGDNTGEHKALTVRTDSVKIGIYNAGAEKVALAVTGTGAGSPILSFPELISSANSDDSMLVMDASSKIVGYRAITGGSTPTLQQVLTAGSTLTGNNTIANAANTLEITNNTLAGISGLKLSSTSTAATGGTQKLFEISLSGANATSGQATYGAFIANFHTGTTATNYGIRATASGAPTNIAGHFLSTGSHTTNTGISVSATGATTNNAVYTADGDVKLNQVSGETFIGLAGSSLGKLNIGGNTSGTVTIKPAAAAGTWSMTLPTTDGNSGEFLQTDGSGVTSWAAGGGITVGTTTITSGTNKAIPFNDSGVYGEDASVFVWDKTNNRLGIGTNSPAYALDVSSTAAATANFESTAAGNMQVNYNSTLGFNVNFTFQNAGSTQWYVGNDGATNRFRALNASGVDKFSILQDGKTGIGTSTPTSTLTNTGSFALPYHKVTADAYVITASDYTLSVDNDVNDWTITLPDPSTCVGRIYIIKRLDNTSVGRIDIGSAGGANVQDPTDGTYNATFNLTGYGAFSFSVMYQSNGTNWEVLK